jgi:hypothetical protein
MPSLSMFYGIIIYMYYKDNNKHHKAHIHAMYQDELVADWKLAVQGQKPYKIEPLR